MLVIDVKEKKTGRIVTIPLEEYEANKDKYVEVDNDPGFTIFCWVFVGLIIFFGIILFL